MSEVNQTSPGGVGTELTRLISWLQPSGCDKCLCALRAAKMDKRGIGWCKKRTKKIIRWLREGAAQCGVPFSGIVAKQVLKVAIHNANRRMELARRTDGEGTEPQKA